MATITYVRGKNKYRDKNALNDVLNYVLSDDKIIHGYTGGAFVDMEDPAADMLAVKAEYGKTLGTQLRHFVISFNVDEISSPRVADKIAQEVAAFIGRTYQVVYAVHEDTFNLHIHLILNTINHLTGNRYRGDHKEFNSLMNGLRNIFRRYKIGIWYVSEG